MQHLPSTKQLPVVAVAAFLRHGKGGEIMPNFGIVIHGGAGAIARDKMTPELESGYHNGLTDSLRAGYAVLERGGASLDAVQTALNVMEDNPLFNAGIGAVLTNAGYSSQDAAIMDGATLKAGAVGAVRHIKNPISLARLVMDKLPHVFLVGEGAEEFARLQGMQMMPEQYFITERRTQQLQEAIEKEKGTIFTELSEGNQEHDGKHGTIGAVALDRHGNLAAATSTGGMSNCRFGRIGDSPIIGAGTYANNLTCAVSATGHGEFFIRAVTAHDLSVMMEYKGMTLNQAATEVVHGKLTKLGGTGGLIAIDRQGNFAMPFNTPGMYRGHLIEGGALFTAIYRD
jgi:L-asparaginase / beta-aspartyl-peptidase